MGVLPAWSLRVAAGEGTLRGAGDDRLNPVGVETWPATLFEVVEWCGLEGVGGDISMSVLRKISRAWRYYRESSHLKHFGIFASCELA